MILFAKGIIKFEEETIFLFDVMRNSLKAVFVKPGFCMGDLWSKMKGPRDFVRYDEECVKNHVR